jgi:hypothetical protein
MKLLSSSMTLLFSMSAEAENKFVHLKRVEQVAVGADN